MDYMKEDVSRLNVREHMTEGAQKMVNTEPDIDAAFERMKMLRQFERTIATNVNHSDTANTDIAWRLAYEQLAAAFETCIQEEKGIIAR